MSEENDDLIFDDEKIDGDEASKGGQAPPPANTAVEVSEMSEEDVLSSLNQIEALADIDPSFRETDDYKNLMAIVDKNRQNDEGVKKGSEAKEIDSNEDDDEENSEDVDNDEKDSDNAFGLGSSIESDDDEDDEIELEITEEMEEFIKSKYGLEKVESFFDTVDTWRNQSQEGAESTRKYDDLMGDLQSLPNDIKSAIQAFSNAEDYRSAFTSEGGNIDYDTDFKDQDKEGIVSNYFAEDITSFKKQLDDGDIDEDDYDSKIELLYKSSKRLFESDKKMVVSRRAELMQDEKKQQQVFKSSITSSVDKLRHEYPNFSKKDLQQVQQRLVNEDIDDLFFNKDGTYKETAAEMLAFASYGKQLVESLLNRASKDGITAANEEIVGKGSKKLRKSKTQRQQKTESVDAVRHLQGQFVKDPYD